MKNLLFFLKKFYPELIFFLIVTVILTFKIIPSYNFESDFGRDVMWMFDIAHGKITLLGPKLSFGGYYLGPYYYYLFTPFLVLTSFLPDGVILGNAIFFAVLATVIFNIFHKNHTGILPFLATLLIVITAHFLFSARGPGNAFSYVALMVLYLVYVLYAKTLYRRTFFFGGLVAGIMLNFHPISALATLPLTLIHLSQEREKRLQKLLLFGIGIGLTLLPVIFFEIRHDFIMTKNTFIYKSYEVFTDAKNIASITVPSKNPITNLPVVAGLVSLWMRPHSYLMFIIILIAAYLTKKKSTFIKPVASLIATLVLYAFLLRFQVATHYLIPLVAIVQVSTIYVVLQSKNKLFKYVVIFILFIIGILSFPTAYYHTPSRNFSVMLAETKKASARLNLPKKNFNVVVIRETPLAVLGYEYRYILRYLGSISDDEFQYKSSSQLLMISERGTIDPQAEDSWEIREFGEKRLKAYYKSDRYAWYLFEKK